MTQTRLLPTHVEDNFRMIPVSPDTFAIVSPEDYPTLTNYRWRLVRAKWNSYAKAEYKRDGKRFTISMHRLVARTPFGMVCHHVNSRTLDNRRQNLRNMSKADHKILHTTNSLQIKYEPITENTKVITE